MGQLFDWISVPISIVGAWPLDKTYFRFTIWLIYYVFYFIGTYADLVSVFGNLELMIANLVETGLQNVIFFRLIVFRFSKTLPQLILAAKEDMCGDNFESEEEKKIYFYYYSSALIFFKTLTAFACCTTVLYSTTPILEYFAYGLKNESDMIMPAYQVRVFIDLNKARNVVLVHILLLPLMAVAIFHVASISVLVALVFNVCARLSILSHRIHSLNSGQNDDASSVFRRFCTEHLRIIRMVQSIENVFQMILLNEIVVITVLLGLIAYNALAIAEDADKSALAAFAGYTLSVLITIYGNCLVGEHLDIECTRLRNAFYHCNWYEMPLTYRRALVICLIRCQIPLQLTAGGFYAFSHASFTDVVKKSMAYVSMLRTLSVK